MPTAQRVRHPRVEAIELLTETSGADLYTQLLNTICDKKELSPSAFKEFFDSIVPRYIRKEDIIAPISSSCLVHPDKAHELLTDVTLLSPKERGHTLSALLHKLSPDALTRHRNHLRARVEERLKSSAALTDEEFHDFVSGFAPLHVDGHIFARDMGAKLLTATRWCNGSVAPYGKSRRKIVELCLENY